MGKKSRRRGNNSLPEFYTKEEKQQQITTLKSKIEQIYLDALFPDIIQKLYKEMENYINTNTEYYYTEYLPAAKRTLQVCFKNKKRFPISITLPHDDNKL
jgi:hypothetical protein